MYRCKLHGTDVSKMLCGINAYMYMYTDAYFAQ